MNKWSNKSQIRLDSCHPDIVKIFNAVLPNYDCTVLEGSRLTSRQIQLFKEGKSKLDGINNLSNHQVTIEEPLSKAIDIVPYPIPNKWGEIDLRDRANIKYQSRELAEFYFFAGHVMAVADELLRRGEITHKLRWGGDWSSDNDLNDQTFFDLPHYEIIEV